MVRIEICADGVRSAENAQSAGVECIELCSSLENGGLTPSVGTLSKAMETLFIPTRVLIRPRSGNYTYDKDETDIMITDIMLAKQLGYEGVVIGALDENEMPDKQTLSILMQAGEGLKFTFHRAIDACPRPAEAVEQLIELGFDKVLTSGGKPSAIEGYKLIGELQQTFGEHIRIMAGGGINADNVLTLLNQTGISDIHASLSRPVKKYNSDLYPKGKDNTGAQMVWNETSMTELARLVKVIDEYNLITN